MFPLAIAVQGSFKRQIILAFVVGFFFLIVAFVAYMVKAESAYRYRDSSDATAGLAQSLAVSSLSWVLANDVVGLQEVVYSFRSYPELRYAMVISPRGRVLAHSDATKVGQFVTDEQSLVLIKAPPGKQVVADNDSIVDVAVPIEIGKRHVGWARVGLGREGIAANLREMILSDTLFVLLATALSLLAAILIANRLGYRIGLLVRVAEEVQAGNFATRASIPTGKDEITKLADSLNQMLDALARNEERLRSASRYTRSLIEASLDPLVTISGEGKITDVNQATEEVTGRSRSELIGTDFSDYFTEPDKAREGYRQVFSKGLVTDYPLAVRHQDGHITDVLYNASVYRNETGEVLGVFAAARDVTERNKTEVALRESEALLQTTMKILPVGLWVIDAEGKIVFSNDAAQRIWAGVRYVGIEQLGEYKGWRLDSGRPVGTHEWAGARALEKGETSIEEEIEIECFDGTHKIIIDSAVPLRNSDGSIHGAVTINQDITERKVAEKALRRSEAQLKEAQRVARIGNWNWDAVNDTIWWSDEYYRIYDLAPEKPAPNYAEHLKAYTAESAERLDAAVKRAMKSGESYELDLELAGTEEHRKWITARGEVKRGANGQIVGLRGTAQDITERKQAEKEVRRLNVELEQRVAARTAELESANKELEAFSYSVSHDLRTPLRAIDGFSLMLLEDYQNKLDDEGKRLLNVVRNNTSRMSRLIDDILRFSRAGRTEISFSEIDMEAMARGVIEELKPLMAGRKLQINLGRLPGVRGDRAMLHQVFENLLSNAIKFTGKSEAARIDIGGMIEADKAVYHVKDNGAGFDMQYAGKLFGVFQRLHGVDEFEGTGIGLAIVKRIIARHGGTVWAEGEVGKGATFYFSIPVNPEKCA